MSLLLLFAGAAPAPGQTLLFNALLVDPDDIFPPSVGEVVPPAVWPVSISLSSVISGPARLKGEVRS